MIRQAQVMYVGPGLVGRTTSLESVLRSRGAPPLSQGNARARTFEVEAGTVRWQVTAQVSVFRAWLGHDDPLDPGLDPRVLAEIEALTRCDGFIFVVDVRPERAEASLEALEVLERDLASRGTALKSFPIVFQANRLDAPGALSMDWVKANFRAPVAEHLGSNAALGQGTLEALQELLRLIALGKTSRPSTSPLGSQ